MSERDAFDRIQAALHNATLDDTHWPTASALIDEACGAKGNNLVYGAGRSADDVRIFLARFFTGGSARRDWNASTSMNSTRLTNASRA